ncbi:hypothetical protein [Mycoplasmopsis adleri]|uniref:hypothetical protein n=1 Tax=Mycoplasmopsis adleri TaxID=51362 RepID=UPI003872C350
MGDDLLYERLVNDDSQSEAYQINFDEKNILHFEWENNNKKGKIVLKKINRSSKYAKYWVYLSSIMNFNKLELKKNNNTYPITKYSFRNELNKYWNDVTSQEK